MNPSGPIVPNTSGTVTPITGSIPRVNPQRAEPDDLTFEQRGSLRDILVPVFNDSEATTFEVDQMIGYTGGHRVRRAYSTNDDKMKGWAMELVMEATNQLNVTSPDWEHDKDCLLYTSDAADE